MPGWAVIVLSTSAVIGAVGIIWKKVVHPFVIGVATFEQNVPVLLAIAGQFRTDSGSSLRDVVNRLEAAAADNKLSNDHLRAALEGARQLAEVDRVRVDRLIALLGHLDRQVMGNSVAIGGVADDLNAAHDRAEAAEGTDGAAADAAWQRPPFEPPTAHPPHPPGQ